MSEHSDAYLDASNQEDLEWLKRFKEGNRNAFDFLVRKYQRQLYSVIYHMTSNREDTADVLQEVFVRVFQNIQQFKGNARFYTWLYRVTINTTLNFLKKRKRHVDMQLDALDNETAMADVLLSDKGVQAGDRVLLLKELQKKMNEAFQSLSHSHRTVLVLFEMEGMNHSQIAELLHCSEGTVRSRLHYAKERLKQILTDYLK